MDGAELGRVVFSASFENKSSHQGRGTSRHAGAKKTKQLQYNHSKFHLFSHHCTSVKRKPLCLFYHYDSLSAIFKTYFLFFLSLKKLQKNSIFFYLTDGDSLSEILQQYKLNIHTHIDAHIYAHTFLLLQTRAHSIMGGGITPGKSTLHIILPTAHILLYCNPENLYF